MDSYGDLATLTYEKRLVSFDQDYRNFWAEVAFPDLEDQRLQTPRLQFPRFRSLSVVEFDFFLSNFEFQKMGEMRLNLTGGI